MISIFNGRSRTLGSDAKDEVYVQVSVGLRQHLHLFTGSSLSVFLCIALHADDKGWARPTVDLICKETGRSRETVQTALAHLRTLQIEGSHILLSYQPISEGNQFQASHYLLFPSEKEVAFYAKRPYRNFPCTETPTTELPTTENPATKYSHPEEEPSLRRTIFKKKPAAPSTPAGIESLDALIADLTALAIYKHIDIPTEAVKADRWCQMNRRKFTRKFFEAWLGRIEVPLAPQEELRQAARSSSQWSAPAPGARREREEALLAEVDKIFSQ